MGRIQMEKSVELTIFTPTYNRAKELPRCYESLKKQAYKNFEWLIIDDGSTDDTYDVVSRFISEKEIIIRYIKQSNQGKQAAWNHAINLAKGELFCGLDSDDTLIENSLLLAMGQTSETVNNPKIIGLRCLAIRHSTLQADGKELANTPQVFSWFQEFSSSRLFGERIDILKTQVIKQFLYPVSGNIRFIPEIWFYTTTAAKGYKFFYSNHALRLFHDEAEENRLSKSSLYIHAEGHFISRSALLKTVPIRCWLRNPVGLIKTIIRFSQVSAFTEKKLKSIHQATNLYWVILTYPIIQVIKFWQKK